MYFSRFLFSLSLRRFFSSLDVVTDTPIYTYHRFPEPRLSFAWIAYAALLTMNGCVKRDGLFCAMAVANAT